MDKWYVYIIKCSDNTLYTGITKDINKRIHEHNNDNKHGSKYTRPRRPVKLFYSEELSSRSEATKRELEIKKMGHEDKINLKNTNKKR